MSIQEMALRKEISDEEIVRAQITALYGPTTKVTGFRNELEIALSDSEIGMTKTNNGLKSLPDLIKNIDSLISSQESVEMDINQLLRNMLVLAYNEDLSFGFDELELTMYVAEHKHFSDVLDGEMIEQLEIVTGLPKESFVETNVPKNLRVASAVSSPNTAYVKSVLASYPNGAAAGGRMKPRKKGN